MGKICRFFQGRDRVNRHEPIRMLLVIRIIPPQSRLRLAGQFTGWLYPYIFHIQRFITVCEPQRNPGLWGYTYARRPQRWAEGRGYQRWPNPGRLFVGPVIHPLGLVPTRSITSRRPKDRATAQVVYARSTRTDPTEYPAPKEQIRP